METDDSFSSFVKVYNKEQHLLMWRCIALTVILLAMLIVGGRILGKRFEWDLVSLFLGSIMWLLGFEFFGF